MKCEENKAKFFEESFLNKKTFLTQTQVENEIENLYTTRSCPTGYKERELKNCTTEELQNLRKITFEYLKFRSSKTRNVQFVHLVKRINKELEDRNVNTNMSLCLLEYSKSMENNNTIFSGEYTLTKKLSNSNSNASECSLEDLIDSSFSDSNLLYSAQERKLKEKEKKYIINTKYFTVKPKGNLEIPSYLLDDNNNEIDYYYEYEILSEEDKANLKQISCLILNEKLGTASEQAKTDCSSHVYFKNDIKEKTKEVNKDKDVFKAPMPIFKSYTATTATATKSITSNAPSHSDEDTLSSFNRHFNEEIKNMKNNEKERDETKSNLFTCDNNPNLSYNFGEYFKKQSYQRNNYNFDYSDDCAYSISSFKECSTKSNSTAKLDKQDNMIKCIAFEKDSLQEKSDTESIEPIAVNSKISNKDEENCSDSKSERTSTLMGSNMAVAGEILDDEFVDLISNLKNLKKGEIRDYKLESNTDGSLCCSPKEEKFAAEVNNGQKKEWLY